MTPGLKQLAEQHAREMATKYAEEFGGSPTREDSGDWASLAWEVSWKDLERAGAGLEDYEELLAAWRHAFFGD